MLILEKKQKNFIVKYSLNAKDIALLQKNFPELNVMVTGRISHPHAVAAVTRDCSEELILRFFIYRDMEKTDYQMHNEVSLKIILNYDSPKYLNRNVRRLFE